jgi:tetratricopeptide (TPR) repeat protein
MNKLISSGFFLKFLQPRNKQTPQFLRKLLKKLFLKLYFKNNLTSIAYHYQQQGKFNEAESYAVQGVLRYPDSWFSNFIAGVVLFNLNQISQSRSYLEKALSLSPDDSQTIHLLTKAIAIQEGLDIAANKIIFL